MVSDPGSTVEVDGIGMRGQLKNCISRTWPPNHPAVGRETRRTGNRGTKAMPWRPILPKKLCADAGCAPVRPHEFKKSRVCRGRRGQTGPRPPRQILLSAVLVSHTLCGIQTGGATHPWRTHKATSL